MIGASTLIKKILMECPICDKKHEVEERKRIVKTIIKGEEVEFEERYYFCENAKKEECEFEFGSMVNENLLKARNAYREKYSLLTSDKIVEIRENYGLTQVDLARLLGWGEATIARYESKAIQDEAYDNILRIIKASPLQALSYLEKNADKFSSEKLAEIRFNILDKLNQYGKEYLTRQAFKGEYVDFEEGSDYNGFTPLNIDKLEAAVSYLAESDSKLYKVKLMKELWYADVISYKKMGHTITGMVYKHCAMGALPIGHKKLINLENLNVEEKERYDGNSMFHFHPTKGMDYSVLSDDEIVILEEVVKRFNDCIAREVIDYMHEEKAYMETEDGEIIPFSLAKEIRDF